MATEVEKIIEESESGYNALVPTLLRIQGEHHYLPEELLQETAERLGLSMAQVYGVATFYKAFSLEPRGKHLCSVCLGTACHVRGAPAILGEAERQLGVRPGETTEDRSFTLERVNCVGACALGPVVVIDGKYYEHVTPKKLRSAIEEIRWEDEVGEA